MYGLLVLVWMIATSRDTPPPQAHDDGAHARLWEQHLRQAGQAVPPPRPSWRARTLRWLATHVGASWVLPTLATLEQLDQHMYDTPPEARQTSWPADERSHARLLGLLARSSPAGVEGRALATLEGRPRAVGGHALRAAVLGANDGLVANLSLVMGVAGAQPSGQGVVITGLAGVLAGACSMAMGEWLSGQSARELAPRQLEIEADEIRAAPHEEQQALALIDEAKGALRRRRPPGGRRAHDGRRQSPGDVKHTRSSGLIPRSWAGRTGRRRRCRLGSLPSGRSCRWLPFPS